MCHRLPDHLFRGASGQLLRLAAPLHYYAVAVHNISSASPATLTTPTTYPALTHSAESSPQLTQPSALVLRVKPLVAADYLSTDGERLRIRTLI